MKRAEKKVDFESVLKSFKEKRKIYGVDFFGRDADGIEIIKWLLRARDLFPFEAANDGRRDDPNLSSTIVEIDRIVRCMRKK